MSKIEDKKNNSEKTLEEYITEINNKIYELEKYIERKKKIESI